MVYRGDESAALSQSYFRTGCFSLQSTQDCKGQEEESIVQRYTVYIVKYCFTSTSKNSHDFICQLITTDKQQEQQEQSIATTDKMDSQVLFEAQLLLITAKFITMVLDSKHLATVIHATFVFDFLWFHVSMISFVLPQIVFPY